MKLRNKNLLMLCSRRTVLVVCKVWVMMSLSSCEEFVKIVPPRTDLVKPTVFTNDVTATAAMLDIYYRMSAAGFASGSMTSFTYLGALSSDELINYNATTNQGQFQQFYENSIAPSGSLVLSLWSEPYQYIYSANAILEGLNSSVGVSDNVKSQLIGEAKFIRAFFHFYLVNLFGDVPLIKTTDYRTNALAPRIQKDQTYEQIIIDLKDAQNLLVDDFSFSNNERVRPNKGAATALLSRVYLYVGDWVNAEIQATSIIGNTSLYGLATNLGNVFLKNSTEAIWQLSNDLRNTNEISTFKFSGAPPPNAALRSKLISDFAVGDKRITTWIGAITNGTSTFYYSHKYKASGSNPIVEYSMVLRVAEQYLIRAEARTELNKISEAQSDLNTVRNRAGLGNTPAVDKSSLLNAIDQERRFELFTEWGHRWLDLKRTNRIDQVLSEVKPNWIYTAALYPIPEAQIMNDINMRYSQNPGY